MSSIMSLEECESVVITNGTDVHVVGSTDCGSAADFRESGNDNSCESEDGESKSTMSLSTIRNFLLTAFSDGYNNIGYCGAGKFQKSSRENDCNDWAEGKTTSTKRVLGRGMQYIDEVESVATSRTCFTTASSHSDMSWDRQMITTRRRPLAMAVNFKYNRRIAEDEEGRPIVITSTGSKTSPIDLSSENRSSQSRTAQRILGSSWSVDARTSVGSFDSDFSEYLPAVSFSSL